MAITITSSDTGTVYKDTAGLGFQRVFNGGVVVDHIPTRTPDTVLYSAAAPPISLNKADISTIDGEAPESAADDYIAQLVTAFPDASSGGGAINFTAMSGTEWNGFNEKTLSGNLDVTIGTKKSGLLLLKNGASHTFAVYGTAITVRNSGTNGGRTTVSYVTTSDGKLWVESDANNLPIEITPPAPDVTAPLPVSFSIENDDPSALVMVTDEPLANGFVPLGTDFTSLLGKTFTPGVAAGVLTLVPDTPYEEGDVEQVVYTPGLEANRLQDAAGNEMAAFDSDDFGGVDNNIASGDGTPTFVPHSDGAWTYNGGLWATNGAIHYQGSNGEGQANAAQIEFTKGVKFQYYAGFGPATYVFQVDSDTPVEVADAGLSAGDVMFEVHPNTGTAKQFYISRKTAGGGIISVDGATTYA